MERRKPVTEDRVDEWTEHVRDLLRTKDNRYVLNCDETFWRVRPNGLRTWADKGAKGASLTINGSDKAGSTVLATIAADGTKLPLMIIAKGKTQRSEQSGIAPAPGEWATHTESEWQNGTSFQIYLKKLR